MKGGFLIADDSAGKVALLTSMLERAGWRGTTYIAQTTKEAMEQIDLDPSIAFAFVDYYIPDKNGPAIIAYLKMMNPKAKIALVSSSADETNAKEARKAGATAVICTSDPMDQVEFQIQEVLGEWLGKY